MGSRSAVARGRWARRPLGLGWLRAYCRGGGVVGTGSSGPRSLVQRLVQAAIFVGRPACGYGRHLQLAHSNWRSWTGQRKRCPGSGPGYRWEHVIDPDLWPMTCMVSWWRFRARNVQQRVMFCVMPSSPGVQRAALRTGCKKENRPMQREQKYLHWFCKYI